RSAGTANGHRPEAVRRSRVLQIRYGGARLQANRAALARRLGALLRTGDNRVRTPRRTTTIRHARHLVDELDPERLRLRETLRVELLPWIVDKAFDTREIAHGIAESNLDPDALADEASVTDHLVISTGPHFDSVYRLALGRDGRID